MSERLVVLVPAHNEQEQIAETLNSLLLQSRKPDLIVVVSDNSTDDTVAVARDFEQVEPDRVVVYETQGNLYRKSGALNDAWTRYAQDADYVFTMDADTELSADFMEKGLAYLEKRPDIGGACAVPMLKDTPKGLSRVEAFWWRSGRLDFGGYLRMLVRWGFQPEVLFGYATLARQEALRQVAKVNSGSPFRTDSIVEDYRLSLDLRRLGWGLAILPGAYAFTDVPTTLSELWIQRVRWAGGTWQELMREGWHRRTSRVWLASIGSLASSLLRVLALVAWFIVFALGLPLAFSPIWLLPIAVAVIDKIYLVRYTRKADRKDAWLSGTLLPMEFVGVIREAWTLVSLIHVLRGKHLAW